MDAAEPFTVSHVHGAAFMEDGALLLATHDGLVMVKRTGDGTEWLQWGALRHDFMGLAQDGADPAVLYASGHPDNPRAYGGGNLGLLRSMDSGATWTVESLRGQADFHALTGAPGQEGLVAGYAAGAFLVSSDGGETWEQQNPPSGRVFSLSSVNGRWLAATTVGLVAKDAEGGDWSNHASFASGLVSSVAVAGDGATWLVSTADGRGGGSYVSTDGGRNFTMLDPFGDSFMPPVFAFHPTDSQVAAVVLPDGRVWVTTDAGAQWDSWNA